MAYTNRQLAPVGSPPPPKPPQLNLCASALMPDLETNTFGPGDGPALVAAGLPLRERFDAERGRRVVDLLPGGQPVWAEMTEFRNALVASVGVMDDLELKQAEQAAGVTPESLPTSVFPATSKRDRWTSGFAYAPENQYAARIADAIAQESDLPYLSPGSLGPATLASATPSNAGGTLTNAHGAYTYFIVPVDRAGGQGTPVQLTATIAAGTTGSVALAWTDVAGTVTVNIYGRDSVNRLSLIGNVAAGAQAFTDTGAATPTLAGPSGNLPEVGFVPFLIQVADIAPAFGWEERDWTGRALRLLDTATPHAIEAELWNGAFAQNALTGPMYQADGPSLNAYLRMGSPASTYGGTGSPATDLTPGTVPSITRGVQILEDYLANTGLGGQGMLHVAPETSPNLLGARRVGALLLSVMDNIIVPGSGYPTTGATGPIGNANADPGAGNAWIYATDLVSVRLDDPTVTATTFAESLDRGNFGDPNIVRIRAQRFAAATWDNARLACCRVALAT
ncbi:MAG: hypothetical protein KGH75_00070 [Rhodospirillales bacterium]|nr:hypothetical protein [Rhodospirillales bacterium]